MCVLKKYYGLELRDSYKEIVSLKCLFCISSGRTPLFKYSRLRIYVIIKKYYGLELRNGYKMIVSLKMPLLHIKCLKVGGHLVIIGGIVYLSTNTDTNHITNWPQNHPGVILCIW